VFKLNCKVMYSPRKALPVPKAQDFGFPYTPYAIQEQLMQELFLVLERKQIGIFESPTGTGKSLTLTCGALTWLQQHEQLVRSELLQRIENVEKELKKLQEESSKAEDWITAQSNTQSQRQELQQLQRLRTLLQQKEQQLEEIKQRRKREQRTARKANDLAHLSLEQEETQTKLELDSDEEEEEAVETVEDQLDQEEERFRDVQIFYCSRTHSQLAQIVAELKKTRHGQQVRCISLGSRQQLCINPQVRRLQNVALMNERCLDMARSKATSITKPNPSKKAKLEKHTINRCGYKAPILLIIIIPSSW